MHFVSYRSRALALLLIATCAIGPYVNTLHGALCIDDKFTIAGNPDVYRSDVPLVDIFAHDFWGNDILRKREGGWTHDSWRPLVTLSYRWDYAVSGLRRTIYYHATNLCVHALSCIVAYFLFDFIFRSTSGALSHTMAWAATTLFALHPIHTESVANLTGRADLMAGLFCFSAVLLYLRCSGVACWCLSLLLVVLGLACKETGLATPALMVLLDSVLHLQRVPHLLQQAGKSSGSSVSFSAERSLWAVWKSLPVTRSLATLAAGAALYYIRIVRFSKGYDLKELANPMHNPMAHISSWPNRVLSISFVQSWAMSMLVWPTGLSHDHSAHELVLQWSDPRNAYTAIVFFVIICVTLWSLRVLLSSHSSHDPFLVGRAARVLLALGWIVISYAPSSHAFVFVAFVIAERTLFVPSWGACLLLVECFSVLADQILSPSRCSGRTEDGNTEQQDADTTGTERAQLTHGPEQRGRRRSVSSDRGRARAPSKHRKGGALSTGDQLAQAPAPTTAGTHLKGSEAVVAATSPSQKPAQATSSSPLRACLPFLLLCAYYTSYTVERGRDWADEETLLQSNLRIYHKNKNGMTLFGLGAIRMYQHRWDEAEALLLESSQLSSLTEPHIFLSQIAWWARGNEREAIRHLERIEYASSARREVMQNLGILLLRQGFAPLHNESARERAERLILVGHERHGYPANHPNTAILASNAACIRLTSDTHRYGNAALALSLAQEGVSIPHVHMYVSLWNLALQHMVQGHSRQAEQALHRAIERLDLDMKEHVARGRSDSSLVDVGRAVFMGSQRRLVSLRLHGPSLASWAHLPPVAGKEARDRMDRLGMDCTMELLER